MRIQNNVPAINAHRYYGINQSNATKSMAKLSSGYRINSAADDAAGLAISEKMRAQIRGLTMASKNAQDAVSLIQTAEGGLQEVDNMLQRIRELVVYASNDTQDNTAGGLGSAYGDRQKIQDEINQLTAEIDSMSERVEFNKKKLLDGSLSAGFVANVSLNNDVVLAKAELMSSVSALVSNIVNDTAGTLGKLIDTVSTTVNNYYTSGVLDSAGEALVTSIVGQINAALLDIAMKMANVEPGSTKRVDGTQDVNEATEAFEGLVKALNNLGGKDGLLMKLHGELDQTGIATSTEWAALRTAIDALASGLVDLNSAEATVAPLNGINDAVKALDKAYDEAVKTAAAGDPTAKGGTLYFQVGANSYQGMSLNIGSIKTNVLGIGDGNQNKNNQVQENTTLNVVEDTGEKITHYLDALDKALSYVTTERSKLGAAQNRLEYTMSSLDISAENLTAAEGRIRDVDMAKEMTNFTKHNVLFQASIAMLAQANAFPQGVLQLLG
jgi:flagellin